MLLLLISLEILILMYTYLSLIIYRLYYNISNISYIMQFTNKKTMSIPARQILTIQIFHTIINMLMSASRHSRASLPPHSSLRPVLILLHCLASILNMLFRDNFTRL